MNVADELRDAPQGYLNVPANQPSSRVPVRLLSEAASTIDVLSDSVDALVSLLRALLREPYVDEDGVVCVKRTTYGMGSDLADLVRPLLNGDEK